MFDDNFLGVMYTRPGESKKLQKVVDAEVEGDLGYGHEKVSTDLYYEVLINSSTLLRVFRVRYLLKDWIKHLNR